MPSQEKIELLKLLEEKARRQKTYLAKTIFKSLYDWQLKFISKTAEYRSCLLMAANRCVTSSALISGKCGQEKDVLQVPFSKVLSLKDFDVATLADESIQTFDKYRAYFQGISPVVRLYLEDGAVLDCTYGHQLLTCEGNYSTIYHLMSETSDHYCLKTLEDYQASCGEGGCQYDQQLHLLSNICQAHTQLLNGALQHTLELSPEDARERIDQHIQVLQDVDLLTIQDAKSHVEDLSSQFLNPVDNKLFELMCDLLRELKRNYPEFLQTQLKKLTCFDKTFCCDEAYNTDIYIPFGIPKLYGGKQILAWQHIGIQPVYDLQVLNSHNYIASGLVSHNCGKTYTGCLIDSFHATGNYPDDWPGYRFTHAPLIWVLGYSGEKIRDLLQMPMVGSYSGGSLEGGLIPKDLIVDALPMMGTPRCLREVKVKHKSGGISRIQFWSYTQGQHALMGDSVDWYHIDEEPKDSTIYPQVITRTATGDKGQGGRGILTFTPENGRTELVVNFMDDPAPSQYMQRATWDDAKHLTEETKEALLAQYPPYQRDMRTKGLPLLGSGLIFDLSIENNKVPAFECPDHWWIINGMDFGWDHPQAHVQLWIDKDEDRVHVAHAWKKSKVQPYEAWQYVKTWAQDVPTAWPHDGLQTEKGSAKAQMSYYAEAGWLMLDEHATWPTGDNGVEQGIMELYKLISLGKLTFANHLTDLFEELLNYHRDDNGKIVKILDDLISALRYAYMMRRYAVQKYDIINQYEDDDYYEDESVGGWG